MPSKPTRAYVWVWLPGATDPVIAGVLEEEGDVVYFNYGRSYLDRSDAVPLYLELPLQPGRQRPRGGMRVAGVVTDAGPDAWGQRVVMHRLLGGARRDSDPEELSLLTYLLESASDRAGALDFQQAPDEYIVRGTEADLLEMLQAKERLEAGEPLSPQLDAALLGGSSLGGVRPKATVDRHGEKLIAKFSSNSDTYPVVKAEGLAMELARRAGLTVPDTEVIDCAGRDVLLIERFDRTANRGERKLIVSALTILELDPMTGRYASYSDLADAIRARFTEPRETLRELFARITFNICVGNTDDHARNHMALWNGSSLTLTPAFDITPQLRSGGETSQAMAIGRDGYRMSQLGGCVDWAETYLLSRSEATAIIDHQLDVIQAQYSDACDRARLSAREGEIFWRRSVLNPYALEGYKPGS